MTRRFNAFTLASALLLCACGGGDQDRLSGNLEGAEGTATINDAELNGMIDADHEAVNVVQAAPPREIPLADIPDPLAPAPASAPSFDCSNVWRDAERLVCADPDLATLDRTMAARYFRALKIADPAQAARLQQSGGAFIRGRNRCTDADCVADAYQDRIAEIDEIMGDAR